MMHGQKFKNFPSSTCHTNSERTWTWNQRFMRGLGSIPTGGNILLLDFFCFRVVKPLIPIFALLPILSSLEYRNYPDLSGIQEDHISDYYKAFFYLLLL